MQQNDIKMKSLIQIVDAMHTLTLRNIPEPLYTLLKERADRHRRSVNNELLKLLEDVLVARPIDEDPFLQEAIRFHESLDEVLPDLSQVAKRHGRIDGKQIPPA